MELPQPAILRDDPDIVVGKGDDAGIDQHRAKGGKGSVWVCRSFLPASFLPLMPARAAQILPERDQLAFDTVACPLLPGRDIVAAVRGR